MFQALAHRPPLQPGANLFIGKCASLSLMASPRRATSALVAAAVVLSTLIASAPLAFAAPLEIDAPGWQVVVPHPPGTAGIGSALSAGDITGDGRDDLSVLYNPDYSFRFEPPFFFSNSSWDIFEGGSGGLAASSLSRSSASLSGFSAARSVTFPRAAPDFNGDGHADFAIATTNYLTVAGGYEAAAELFYGSASGLPGSPSCRATHSSEVNQSASYSWLTGGDYDGDGASDLVLMETIYSYGPPQNNTGVSALYTTLRMVHGGQGCTPRFEPEVWFPQTADGYPQLVGWGDFNGDGKDDAVVEEVLYLQSSNAEHHIHVLPGTSTGPSNASMVSLTISTAPSTRMAAGIDMDGDGYGDLALLLGYQAGFVGQYYSILVYPGGPTGLSSSARTPQDLPGQAYASAVPSFGDLDGDGALDLVLVHSNSSAGLTTVMLDLYFGSGGVFPTTRDWNATVSVRDANASSFFGNVAALEASGDFDGDGRDDLVLLVGSSGSFPGPLATAPVTVSASSAVLLYYGYQILRDVSGVEPVGFDSGVAYPTFEYGFNVLQRASNRTYFDGFSIQTEAGALGYDPALDRFSFTANSSLAPGDYLPLHGNSTAAWDEPTHTWDIRFRFEFSWTFPSEEMQTYRLVSRHNGTPLATGRGVAGTFRLEKDFALVGTLALRDTARGLDLASGSWVAASAPLQAGGLTVSFEGAPTRLVPPAFYNWSATDDDFTIWNAPGGPLGLAAQADTTSDPGDNLTVGLVGLPDPGVGAPTAAFTFRVDADAPTFADGQPSNDSWIAQKVVTLAIVANDPLSGIDLATLQYQTSTAGPGAFGPWVSPSLDASDTHAVRARADTAFEDGEGNFFRFRVKDLVGNGYSESPPFQVRVDTLHVTFWAPAPLPDVWQRATTVPVAVTVTDLGASGVLASSVALRTSTDDIFAYGPWVPVAGLSNAVELRAAADALLAQGDVNYVQWRAEDIVGTGLTLSGHFQVRVDAAPVAFGNFTPDPALRRTNVNLTVEIRLADSGPFRAAKSGINPSSVRYRFAPEGADWGNWTSTGLLLVNLDGRNWTAGAQIHLVPGPLNRVEFQALDLAGNGPASSGPFALHLNRAPTANLSLNVTNSTVFLNESVALVGAFFDPEGDRVSFEWQDEAGATVSNNSTTLNLTLPLGNHTFRFTVVDAFGASAEAQITIHVLERPLPPPPPPPPPPVQEINDGFSMLTLALALLGASAVALLVAASRRAKRGSP